MKRSLLSRIFAVVMIMALAMTAMVACKKPEPQPEEKTVTTIEFYTQGTDNASSQLVWAQLNQHLEATDAKLHVNCHYVANAEYNQTLTGLLSAGSDKVDVVYSYSDFGYLSNANAEYFAALDEYLDTNAKGIKEVCPAFGLDACRVNGKLYGVPTMKEWSAVYAVVWNNDLMTVLGLADQVKNLKWNTVADWNDLFYQIKDARDNNTSYELKGDSYAYFNGAFTQQAPEGYIDYFKENGLAAIKDADIFDDWDGGTDLFSVVGNTWVLDALACDGIGMAVPEIKFFADAKDNTVFNAFATPEYAKAVKLYEQWNKDGILSAPDGDIDGLGTYWIAERGDFLQGIGSTCGQVSIAWNNNLGGASTTLFTADCNACQARFATRSYIQASVMTVAYCSKKIEAAVDYLNLIYTDKTLIDTFRLGVEGIHWNKTADGRAEFVNGIGGGSVAGGWYNWYGVNYGGNFLACTVPTTQSATVLEELASCSKIGAPSVGMDFDTTEIQNYVGACNTAVSTYITNLQFGSCEDTEAYLAEFLSKFDAAGAAKIVAEYQKQVDGYTK